MKTKNALTLGSILFIAYLLYILWILFGNISEGVGWIIIGVHYPLMIILVILYVYLMSKHINLKPIFIVMIALIVILSLSTFYIARYTDPNLPKHPEDFYECSRDDECVDGSYIDQSGQRVMALPCFNKKYDIDKKEFISLECKCIKNRCCTWNEYNKEFEC